jgi:HEAT repeat protein
MHMNLHCRLTVVILLLCSVAGTRAGAQTPAAVDPAAAALGRAWTAIAAGRPAEAVAAADELLKSNPRDRRAVTVKVEALASAAPVRALDAYEKWLTIVSTEDIFLLDPVARGTLERIASETDARLRLDALEILARAGVRSARERLSQEGGGAGDLALARLGDRAALARLKGAGFDQKRPELRIDILSLAGASAFDSLRPFLAEKSGAVRAKAIEAIGRVAGKAAIEDLRAAAADPEFHVRATANVALAKLGDAQALSIVQEMLSSPVPDVRLLAATAFADRGPGPWVDALLPLLNNNEGVIKLKAAELLAPVKPEAARSVLEAAAEDGNPVVRVEAARVSATPAVAGALSADLASLRRALRNADPAVRLHAASAILAGLAPK